MDEGLAAWTTRYYLPGDEEGMLDCLVAAFGRWPGYEISVSPIDHLRWKMSSHDVAPRFHYVAEAEGRIVGTTIVVARPMKVGNRTMLCANYTDFSFHPDYQGKGLMKPFWAYAERDVAASFQLLVGISGNEAIRKHMVTVGRRPLANAIELLECPLARASESTSTGSTLRTTDRFDERVTSLWRAAAPAFEFIVARTDAYLNWRYADPRAGIFTIRLVEDGNDLIGYSVLTKSRGDGVIADLFALPDRDDAVEALVADAQQWALDRGCSAVRCWSPRHHPSRSLLERRGFRVKRHIRGLGFAPYGDADISFTATDENLPVHFGVGDTDLV